MFFCAQTPEGHQDENQGEGAGERQVRVTIDVMHYQGCIFFCLSCTKCGQTDFVGEDMQKGDGKKYAYMFPN